jgi:hypothetical protein
MTAIRRRFGDDIAHPDRRQHRLHGRGRAPRHAGDGRARHRLARGAVPGARPPLLRHGQGFGRTPLAAGENHYTRFEFHRVIEDGNITILQPDLSRAGGITEVQRIAAAASMWKLPIHPHSSMTGLNHAVSIHFLASIDNGGYFEADLSVANKFRDELGSEPWRIGNDWLRCVPWKSRNRRGKSTKSSWQPIRLIEGPDTSDRRPKWAFS